ncbi:MAG: peptidylprolyl isomerase [Calditrichaceae bacterium]|nr:peptidylprolyl isomerase [Calditrichaceae bacterium]MBN2708583.1 peptidylprolyl isomerase [Calditrichaceae bacterium]
MRINLLFYVVVLLLIMNSCVKKEDQKIDIIARIDEDNIALEAFRLFYELDPNFGIFDQGSDELRKELDLYLAQIAAADKAAAEGLLSETTFGRAVEWEKRQAILREFFRQEVLEKIQVSEIDLKKEYLKENIQVLVRHLFSKSAETIQEIQQKLDAGETFESLASQYFSDSLIAEQGGKLGWIRLGDLDEDFADAVMQLADGEISGIVKTRWGYHIIQLLDKKENLILRQAEFEQRKKVLENKIKRNRGKSLGNEYVRSIMQKNNPQPDENGFLSLWRMVTKNTDKTALPVLTTINPEIMESESDRLKQNLNNPLIIDKNGAVSIGEFLESMKSVPVGHRPEFRTMRELSDQIAVWHRDNILYDKALNKGIQNSDPVQNEVRRFIEEQSFNYYLQDLLQVIEIPSEVRAFYETKDISLTKKYPLLKKVHTIQEYRYHLAQEKLIKEFLKPVEKISINYKLLEEENLRINWNRRIRMFMVRKPG